MVMDMLMEYNYINYFNLQVVKFYTIEECKKNIAKHTFIYHTLLYHTLLYHTLLYHTLLFFKYHFYFRKDFNRFIRCVQ